MSSSNIIQGFGIHRFARNRLLSLHDACVTVTQTPTKSQKTKIEKSFEAMRSKKNKKRYLTEALDKQQYGHYIVDPQKNLFENYSKSMMMSSDQQQQQQDMFFTAINKHQSASLKRSRPITQDLPRHVPRHVVQPLQEPPFTNNSPIAKFSPIPLFAITSFTKSEVEQQERAQKNKETAGTIHSAHNWNPFSENKNNTVSSLSWMPQVELLSTNTEKKKKIHPHHVLPKNLQVHVREKTLVKNQVVVNDGKFENQEEMAIVVSEGRYVESSTNDTTNISKNEILDFFVSFQRLSVPIPEFLQAALNLRMMKNPHQSKNKKKEQEADGKSDAALSTIYSQRRTLKFWTSKLKKAGLLHVGADSSTSKLSSMNSAELTAVWWYYVWIHRNYSIRWLVDINHLFATTSSSSNNLQQENQINKNNSNQSSRKNKRRFFLPSSPGLAGKEAAATANSNSNNKKKKGRKLLRKAKIAPEIEIAAEQSDHGLISNVMSTFTHRPVRDADNFGQRESRKKSRYAKYDLGMRRRKSRQLKKMSSLMKRKMMTMQNKDNNSSNTKSSSRTHHQKFGSANEFILHKLAHSFSLMKPRQLRMLVNHYRLFLHYCDVAHTNDKRLCDESSDESKLTTKTSTSKNINKNCNNKKNNKKSSSTTSTDALVQRLNHMSITLPIETYVNELKIWREWRLVYAFFPIFALKAAMFGSGLPLIGVDEQQRKEQENKKFSSSNSSSNSSSVTLARSLGFDFVIANSGGTTKEEEHHIENAEKPTSSKKAIEVSDLLAFKTGTKPADVIEDLCSSSCLHPSESSVHPTEIDKISKRNNSLPQKSRSGFLLDPASSISTQKERKKQIKSKFHLSTEMSPIELAQMKTRSGYWVFRNALPAIDPKSWWKHFVVSSTTCAEKWNMMTGEQRTLFDTLPTKRSSGARRSDPFYAFLRHRVAEASALRKKFIEMKRKEKATRKQENNSSAKEENDEEELDERKFPFLEKDTNLPVTFGKIVSQAFRDWKMMHPYEQAQYYDQTAIKMTFPEFEGFKKGDALMWQQLIDEEENKQLAEDEFDLFGEVTRGQNSTNINNNGIDELFQHHSNNKNNQRTMLNGRSSSAMMDQQTLRQMLANEEATTTSTHHQSHLLSSVTRKTSSGRK